jgi:hypothetical protein
MEFFRFKGVDWLGMVFTILSLYYLGKHYKRGFLFSIASSLCWMVFGFLVHSWAAIVSNLIYILFSIKAWHQWKADQNAIGSESATRPD